MARRALARAGGTAIVTVATGADPAAVAAILGAMREAGIPTQQR